MSENVNALVGELLTGILSAEAGPLEEEEEKANEITLGYLIRTMLLKGVKTTC